MFSATLRLSGLKKNQTTSYPYELKTNKKLAPY
jgi:hypothetical protein